MSVEKKSLKSSLLIESGTNALDLVGRPIEPADFMKAEALIEMSFGADFAREKFTMLWDMIGEDGWTAERLHATTKNFLKTKKYATWTIADWYDFDVKVYPYSWYLEQIRNGMSNDNIEIYKYENMTVFKLKDGVKMPVQYEKI
jgi:hypothetical protein